MERQRVRSSVIATIGYDPNEHTLEVEFHAGRIYRYFRVPPSEVVALLRADSIGSYFNREIRKRYKWAQVRAGKPSAGL